MANFPLINDLPQILQTERWHWVQFPNHGFWLATDKEGHQWLAKMRGSFKGYRELVFAKIAQRLGWSCQSSAFAVLDDDVLPMRQSPKAERIQLLSWLLSEHSPGDCGLDCPFPSLDSAFNAPNADRVEVLENSCLTHIMDWPRSEIAAAIFGANDGPDKLFTTDHELVIIDSEEMFSSGIPSDLDTRWRCKNNGLPSAAGMRLTREVCSAIGSLSDKNLLDCLAVPKGIENKLHWRIDEIVFKAKAYCQQFLRYGAKP